MSIWKMLGLAGRPGEGGGGESGGTRAGGAGALRDIVDRLNREVNAAMKEPEVQKHLDQEMVQTKAMTPDEFTAFMQAEVNQIGRAHV